MKVPCPGCVAMMLSEAKKYHGYARECLKLAEEATRADVREQLVELSRIWMEAALKGGAASPERDGLSIGIGMNLPALQRGAKLCGPDNQIARSAAERGHINRGK